MLRISRSCGTQAPVRAYYLTMTRCCLRFWSFGHVISPRVSWLFTVPNMKSNSSVVAFPFWLDFLHQRLSWTTDDAGRQHHTGMELIRPNRAATCQKRLDPLESITNSGATDPLPPLHNWPLPLETMSPRRRHLTPRTLLCIVSSI